MFLLFLNTECVEFKLFRRTEIELSCDAFEKNNYLCVSNLNNQIILLQWQSNKVHGSKQVRKCFKMNGQRYSITHLTSSQSYGGIQ